MNICIYSKREDDKFTSQEHIIPAFLGGRRKLEKGYVSDIVNNNFSGTIEDQFAHVSRVSILRDLFGPGKRGARHYSSQPMVGQKKNGSTVLVQGNPDGVNVMSQLEIKIESDTCYRVVSVIDSLNTHESDGSSKSLFQQFLDMSACERVFFEENGFIKARVVLVTKYRNCWYIYARNNVDIRKLIEKIKHSKIIMQTIPVGFVSEAELNVGRMAFENVDTQRALAKICFNYLASSIGQSEILNNRYDDVRYFILRGDINEKVKINSFHGVFDTKKLFEEKNIQKDAHVIAIKNIKSTLYGILLLYGQFLFSITLCEKYDSGETDKLFVCEWRTQKEWELDLQTTHSRYFLSHEEASMEENLHYESVLGKKPTERNKELIKATINNKEIMPIVMKYSSKDNNYFSIGIAENKWIFSININYPEEFVNSLLTEGLIYITCTQRVDGFCKPTSFANQGEVDIANYINLITSYSIIDRYLKTQENNYDLIYETRFMAFATNIANASITENSDDFHTAKYALELAIMGLYEMLYFEHLSILIDDKNRSSLDKAQQIIHSLKNLRIKDIIRRKGYVDEIINLLGIKDHVWFIIEKK